MAGLKIFLIVLIVQIEFVENCVRWEGLKEVSSCPRNQAEWEEAAKRKNCRNLQERENCENATYHCLVDSSRTALVEVCTVPRNLNGYCPLFYETDLPFVRNDYRRDCSKYDNESSCASFYSSTDAYKYQACYNISTDQTKVSSTVPQQTTVGSPAKTTSVVETELTTKVNARGGLGGTEDKGNNTWIIGVVIFILILLIVLVYIGTVIYQWKCKEKTFRQALCFCCNALCNWFRDRKRRENNEDAHIELGQGTPDQEDAPLLLSESGIKNDSVIEGKGHQMEQTGRHPESNGTSHECSEDITDVKREDALIVDVSADVSITELPEAPVPVLSPTTVTTYMKKTKRGRRGTVPIEYAPQQSDDTVFEPAVKDLNYLENGLVKGEKRILDLLFAQYAQEGRIRYLEIKVSSATALLCKLAEEISEEPYILEEMTLKKTLINRVKYLDKSFGSISLRIKEMEQSLNSSQSGPPALTSDRTSISESHVTAKGACGTDVCSRVKIILEVTLPDIEERIDKLYKVVFGKRGQLEVLLAKVEGLERAVDEVEHEHEVPQSTASTAKEGSIMKMASNAPSRLLKLNERIENLAPYIWK